MNWRERLLAPLVSERDGAGWRGWLWLALLALAPVAYVTAMVLGSRLETGGVRFVPPAQAVERARQIALDCGVDVTGWREVIAASFETDLNSYFDDPRYLALPAERKRWAPYATTRVTFLLPSRRQWVQVRMRPDGSLLGVRLSPAVEPEPHSLTEDEAKEVAVRELLRLLSPPPGLNLDEVETLPGDQADTRRFRWQVGARRMPEFRSVFTVDVQGRRAIAVGHEFSIDRAAAAAREDVGGRAFQTLRGVFFVLLACYALYRFARRSMEKEVALARCGILFGAIVSLVVSLGVIHPGRFFGDLDPERLREGWWALVMLSAVLTSLLGGILLALSYGGSEGELREIYPGKLTSLDAFLTGRWFSVNVGSALVFGMAAAGWGLLLDVLGEQVFRSLVPRFVPGDATLSYVSEGWIPLLLAQPGQALFACTYGLLLPLMFANRHITAPLARRGVIVAMGLMGATAAVEQIDFQMPWTVVRLLAVAALMLAAFWVSDFLSAVVATNLFLVGHAVALLAPLGGDWPAVVRYVVLFTVLTAVMALGITYRGERLADETVRPKYAERLLERLGLQAEVSAAREAQLRLLPKELPHAAGWRLAASCTPANEVGGDFYDFFPLAGGGWAVLVAEGGSTGLASALTIGLAKGFLLHAAERGWSPGEALRHLRPVLTRAVQGNIDRLGLAYMAMGSGGEVRVARFGAYPKLVEMAPGSTPREVELLGLAEEEFVGESKLQLAPGSTLLMATDGLMERLRQRSGSELAEWLARNPAAGGPADLHALLLQALEIGGEELADDLTLVLVERPEAVPARREGVA